MNNLLSCSVERWLMGAGVEMGGVYGYRVIYLQPFLLESDFWLLNA